MSDFTIYQDGQYLANNPTWHEEDSPWKASQIQKMIGRHRLEPRTVCEVGSGAGGVLHHLQQLLPGNVQLTGYEISPQALSLSFPKENDQLKFIQGDLRKCISDEPYDILLTVDVFEHIDDYIGFLRDIRPAARNHIFHIPLDLSIQTMLRVQPILQMRESVGHLHHFTKEIALDTLRYAGYEIVDYQYTSGALELPSLTVKARLLKLPRKILFRLNQDFAVRLCGGFSLLVLAK